MRPRLGAAKAPVLLLASLTVALGACGSPDDSDPENVAAEQAEARSTSSVVANGLDGNAVPPSANETDKRAISSASQSAGISSRYTEVSPDNCKTVEEELEEGTYVRQLCTGIAGYPLTVAEGDGRMNVHAGNDPVTGETIAPFNTLGDRVEWRLENGNPFAIIYRLKVVAPESADAGRSQLFVSKIGKNNGPSCVIAEIAGDYPDANEKARRVADENRDFDCKRNPKLEFGNIIP